MVSTTKINVPPLKTTTTCHITKMCECLDCGKTTGAKADLVHGTSLGPNLPAEVADCWENGTYEGVADSLENKYGVKFSKTTIPRALDAVAASRSRAAFGEHVMVPGRLATVDVYGCHTAVLGSYIAGCRSRDPGRREGRYGTDLLPRRAHTAGALEIPVPHSKEGPARGIIPHTYGRHWRYQNSTLPNSPKHWPRRHPTCSRSYCTIWSPQTTTPRGACALLCATATCACRYAACAACGGAMRCGRASVRGGCAAPRYTVSCGGALPGALANSC